MGELLCVCVEGGGGGGLLLALYQIPDKARQGAEFESGNPLQGASVTQLAGAVLCESVDLHVRSFVRACVRVTRELAGA